MTKERLKEQVTELLINTMKKNTERIGHLINSGAIDFSEEPNGSWSTAKVVLSVLLKEASEGYKPTIGKPLEDYRNLLNF